MGLTGKLAFVFQARGPSQLLSAIFHELLRFIYVEVLRKRYVKRQIFDWNMYLDLEDKGISRALWLFGRRELDHKWITERVLNRGDVVLDIGANIGYYALMELGQVGETGKVIAVEPSPENIKMLRKNLSLNQCQNCEVIQGAVSNNAGRRKFWLAQHSNLNTFHKEFLEETGAVKEVIEVEVFAIQELLARKEKIDLIRMDIEGHEVEVLEGVCDFLTNSERAPDIIFETHTRSYSQDHDIKSVIQRLAALGYEVGYAASSAVKGTRILERKNLPVIERIQTDDVIRTIHQNIPIDILIDCLTNTGGIRTVFLHNTAKKGT
jgi:FkbM family methyltransferase